MKRSQILILVCVAIALATAAAVYWFIPTFLACNSPRLALRIVADSRGTLFDFSTEYPPGSKQMRNRFFLSHLRLDEIDKHGKVLRCMWSIERLPEGDPYLKSITYGKVPAGWQELQRAQPMKAGIYNLNSGNVFVVELDGSFRMLPGEYHYPDLLTKQLEKMGI